MLHEDRRFTYKATITQTTLISPKTYITSFGLKDDTLDFQAGQYIWVELLSPTLKDPKGTRRAFSILNSPNHTGTIEILYKEGTSDFKKHLIALTPDTEVKIHGPFGHTFTLKDPTDRLVFIAGGTGIAPFLSLVSHLADHHSQQDIQLLFYNDQNVPYLSNQLDTLAQSLPHFTHSSNIHHLKLSDIHDPTRSGTEFYISGPQGFIDHVFQILTGANIPRSSMVFEQYYPSPVPNELIDATKSSLIDNPPNTKELFQIPDLNTAHAASIAKLIPYLLLLGIGVSIFVFLIDFCYNPAFDITDTRTLSPIVFLLLYLLFRLTKNSRLTANLTISFLFFGLLRLAFFEEYVPDRIIWINLIPITALTFTGQYLGLLWSFSFVTIFSILHSLSQLGLTSNTLPNYVFMMVIMNLIATTIVTGLLNVTIHQTREQVLKNFKVLIEALNVATLFKKVVENASNHIIVTDKNGLIRFANKAAENMTGYTRLEMQGNTPRLWGGTMQHVFYQQLWHDKLEGRAFKGEILNRRKTGQNYHTISTITPIIDGTSIVGYIGVEEDITNLKTYESQILENEQRWQLALDSGNSGVWDWDLQTGTILFSNSWKKLLGLSRQNLDNDLTVLTNLIYKDDLPRLKNLLDQIKSGETDHYTCEYRIRHYKGHYLWVVDRGRTITKNSQAVPLRFISILTDITDIKEAQKNSAYLATVIADSYDAIYSFNLDGIVTSWNKASQDLYGYTPQEMLGQSITKIFPEDRLKELSTFILQTRQGHNVKNYQTTRLTKSGSLLDIAITYSPILDVNGEIIGASVIARDISREKEINRMKTDFISLASHQLRTPLSGIKWLLEVLKDNTDPQNPTQQDLINNINEANNKMIDLVRTLLNISRIESGRIAITTSPLKIDTIIKNVLKDIQPLYIQKQHTLRLNLDPACPEIVTDEKLVQNVLLNLISNAFKYTPDHGQIEISTTHTKDHVIIQIKDNGYGIPQKEQASIFHRFFRASNVASKDTEGTGLGLYLVKIITTALGASITFVSQESEGSTFTLSLPITGLSSKQGEVNIDNSVLKY